MTQQKAALRFISEFMQLTAATSVEDNMAAIDKLEIPLDMLDVQEEIGRGQYGVVKSAILAVHSSSSSDGAAAGHNQISGNSSAAALKRLCSSSDGSAFGAKDQARYININSQ